MTRLDPYQPTHFLVGGRLLKHVDPTKQEEVERAIIASSAVGKEAKVINGDDSWKHQAAPVQPRRWDWRDLSNKVGLDEEPEVHAPDPEETELSRMLRDLQGLQQKAKDKEEERKALIAKEKEDEMRATKKPMHKLNDIGFSSSESERSSERVKEGSASTESQLSVPSRKAPAINPVQPKKAGKGVPPRRKSLAPRMVHLATALQPLKGRVDPTRDDLDKQLGDEKDLGKAIGKGKRDAKNKPKKSIFDSDENDSVSSDLERVGSTPSHS